jgi:predicted phage-related endonuclease
MSMLGRLEQGSTAWHQHRALHANASEAAAVMGVSPWEPDTWFKLWQLKTGRVQRPSAAPHVRRGADMEAKSASAVSAACIGRLRCHARLARPLPCSALRRGGAHAADSVSSR